MDKVSPEKRSLIMAAVRSKNTSTELRVRRLVHGMGYRFRLHKKSLPGCPDLVFPSRRKVIFVHGCFWHRHARCRYSTTPKTRVDFWKEKFEKNVARDRRIRGELKKLGWDVLQIWQCELSDLERVAKKIGAFLEHCG